MKSNNRSLFTVDTSMDTSFTYSTISTNRAWHNHTKQCLVGCHHGYQPNLMDRYLRSASSTDTTSEASVSSFSTPPATLVKPNKIDSVSQQDEAPHHCTSRVCPACRGRAPMFVPASTGKSCTSTPPRFFPPRWWEPTSSLSSSPSSFCDTLTEHLGEWVERQIMSCEQSLPHRRGDWRPKHHVPRGPDDVHEAPLAVPFDEQNGQ